MKKVTVLGILAAAMLTGGLTAYAVQKATSGSGSGFIEYNDKVPSHFTAYEKDGYPDLTYAAENAVQAVVSIEKKEAVEGRGGYSYGDGGGGFDPFFEFFGIPQQQQRQQQQQMPPQERRSSGSGVIITPDGYIVSNNHVIENASELKVTLNDDRTFTAKIIGTDPTTDIALIKIDGENLPSLPFGNSDALRLGEWVLAIGAPYNLASTVTAGIVSAKARNLDVIQNQMRLESFIQTDAAVNPGNSGGALVNTKGELVGINTVIKSPTGSYAGYSFAVPTSIVKKVVTDLKEFGMVQRAMLGVMYQEINDDFIERMGKETGIKEKGGIYIADLDPDGAAIAAGIKKGDIIIEIDGVKIDVAAKLSEQIAKHRPNDQVKVSVKRDGEVKHFDVVLRNKAGKAELMAKDAVDLTVDLGGQFADITDRAKKELKISNGIQVVGISEGGILSKARVRKGYIITHINDTPIRSVSDLNKITSKVKYIDGVYPDGKFMSYSLAE